MPGYIHHVEWCVSDLQSQVKKLVSQYGFQPIGQRIRKIENALDLKTYWTVQQVAVKSGDTIFIITQKSRTPSCQNEDIETVKNDEYPISTCCQDKDHIRDTVFNVALTVGSHLEDIVEKIKNRHGIEQILVPLCSINDCRLAVIKSCCGNVIHTLLDKKTSLKGFEEVTKSNIYGNSWEDRLFSTSHMDHITYVCTKGQSFDILAWYSDIFKMKRFLVNPQESEEGVEITGDVNMRLTVGEWMSSWLCREEGVQFEDENANSRLNFKLVLAEPLDNGKDSHVQKFLNCHGGPGLQHIGLATSNVAETVQIMTDLGAQFRNPPPTYYKLESKVREITEAGENIEQCAKLGLLFDTEADYDHQKIPKLPSYLVQVFTKPVFGPKQDTFFLEVLERRGAKGFGAGNISALAQSIILYQQELEKRLF